MKEADVNIFVETALCSNDCSQAYFIPNFTLFRNDFNLASRTTYGAVMYVKQNVKILSQPLRCNYNDVEMTLLKVDNPINNLHIVGIYCSKSKVTISRFQRALKHLFDNVFDDSNVPLIILGDFNINLFEKESEGNAIYKYLTQEKQCVQIINRITTDYKTQIDHIYTNLQERVQSSGVLESYFSDHKPIFISVN